MYCHKCLTSQNVKNRFATFAASPFPSTARASASQPTFVTRSCNNSQCAIPCHCRTLPLAYLTIDVLCHTFESICNITSSAVPQRVVCCNSTMRCCIRGSRVTCRPPTVSRPCAADNFVCREVSIGLPVGLWMKAFSSKQGLPSWSPVFDKDQSQSRCESAS